MRNQAVSLEDRVIAKPVIRSGLETDPKISGLRFERIAQSNGSAKPELVGTERNRRQKPVSLNTSKGVLRRLRWRDAIAGTQIISFPFSRETGCAREHPVHPGGGEPRDSVKLVVG